MHYELKYRLLDLKFLLHALKVDQFFFVSASNYLFFFHHRFGLGKIARVTCHVSSQDDAQEAQPEGLVFVLSKSFQKVESLLVQNSERLSSVHVLVHGLITVAYCELRH